MAMELEEREGEGSDHEQMRTGWDGLYQKSKKTPNKENFYNYEHGHNYFQPIQ